MEENKVMNEEMDLMMEENPNETREEKVARVEKESKAGMYENMVKLGHELIDHTDSEEDVKQGWAYLDRVGEEFEPWAFNVVVDYLAFKNYEKALYFMKKAREYGPEGYISEIDEDGIQACFYRNVAFCYKDLEDHRNTLRYLLKSRQFGETTDEEIDEARRAVAEEGFTADALYQGNACDVPADDIAKALALYDAAAEKGDYLSMLKLGLHVISNETDPETSARGYHWLDVIEKEVPEFCEEIAKACEDTGHLDEAIRFFKRARIYNQTDDYPNYIDEDGVMACFYRSIGEVFALKGDQAEARRYYDMAESEGFDCEDLIDALEK